MHDPTDRLPIADATVPPAPLSTRRRFMLACGAGAVALGLAGVKVRSLAAKASPSPTGDSLEGLRFARRTSRALGSDISMLVLHEDPAMGEKALDAAFAELARVEQVMSLYLPQSQVSQLNARGFLKNPDPHLVRILREALALSEQSMGAFDVTVQPLWTVYAGARSEGKLPAPTAIGEARRHVGWRGISVTTDEIRFLNQGMALTLNGIAQGYAADRAMEALKGHGIQHALVNTGEISALGRKAAGTPWVVGIQHPRQKDAYLGLAGLHDRCLSTSGDYETTFSPDFAQNHIFDPATGRSPDIFSSVTVVAPEATLADALSTAIFVLGPERGLKLAGRIPGTDVLMVMKDQRTLATPSFPWSPENYRKSGTTQG